MKYFKYKAVFSSGEVTSGIECAENALALNRALSARGLTVLSYRSTWLLSGYRQQKWSRKDVIGFVFHLEQMLTAGIPVLDALDEFRLSIGKQPLVSTVNQLIQQIDSGKSLSAACETMPAAFDRLFVSLIQVGERSGNLEKTLRELGLLLQWQDDSVSRFRRMLIYPAFVTLVLFALIVFLMTWLVPGMVSFISAVGANLPWHTKALIGVSNVVSTYWIPVVLTATGLGIGLKCIVSLSHKAEMTLARYMFSLPVIGTMALKLRLSRFTRCAAMMYSAGINIVDVLRFAADTLENRLLEKAVAEVGKRLTEGQGIAASFKTESCFPPLFVRVLKVGETTGTLDVSFNQLSRLYDRESRELSEKLEKSLGPLMTVAVGLIMMWVVLSVISPIYDLVFGMSSGAF